MSMTNAADADEQVSSLVQPTDDDDDRVSAVDDADTEYRDEVPLFDADHKENVSANWTLLTFLRGMMGPGCLALPVAFSQAGLWAGLALVIMLGLLNLHCMRLLMNSAKLLCEKSGKLELDYGHLAKKAFDYGPRRWRKHSRKPLYITNMVIGILQLGVCAVLFVFMARHIKEILEEVLTDDFDETIKGGMNIRYYLLALLPPVILLNYIRSMRVLAFVSTLANVIMLGVLAVIFQHLILADHSSIIPNLPAINSDLKSIVVACGSILYAFEGQALVLPLENRIADKTAMRGPFGVLSTGMYLVTLTYAVTGFFGYITYGDQVQGSITLNLPDNLAYDLVKAALVLVVFFGYAVQMYVVIEMIWPAIRRKCLAGMDRWHLFLEYVFRTAMVVLTFLLAAAVPELKDIIPLVGVTAGMLLAFVFPPLLEIITFWRVWARPPAGSRLRRAVRVGKNCLLIAFGCVGLVSGVVFNIQKIIDMYPN